MVKYAEGTFLLAWEKSTGDEDLIGENSSATLYEMQMKPHPHKTVFYVREKEGIQPQKLDVSCTCITRIGW